MRKNFTAEQMLHAVPQAEGGMPVAEVCRKVGITEQIFYKWKRRVAGMGPRSWPGCDSWKMSSIVW